MAPVPSQSAAQTALRGFLLAILPAGVPVVQGQDNRVSEPSQADYVVITAMRRMRLATNGVLYADSAFVASMSGAALTVSEILIGPVVPGAALLAYPGNSAIGTLAVGESPIEAGVALGSVIGAQQSGAPGGVGVYGLSPAQTLPSGKFAAGVMNVTQKTEMVWQVDVYGPNSGDNAQTISTLFRDGYATQWWARNGYATTSPLYADDPMQMPFMDDQQQVENRWKIEAHVQVDATVAVSQDFADTLVPTLIVADLLPIA